MGFIADYIHTHKESVTQKYRYIETVWIKTQREQKTEKESRALMICEIESGHLICMEMESKLWQRHLEYTWKKKKCS